MEFTGEQSRQKFSLGRGEGKGLGRGAAHSSPGPLIFGDWGYDNSWREQKSGALDNWWWYCFTDTEALTRGDEDGHRDFEVPI